MEQKFYIMQKKTYNLNRNKQGLSGQKWNIFYVLLKTYFKISFLDKKNLDDRLCFKDDIKFQFNFLED